jgi:hypothetical protein
MEALEKALRFLLLNFKVDLVKSISSVEHRGLAKVALREPLRLQRWLLEKSGALSTHKNRTTFFQKRLACEPT